MTTLFTLFSTPRILRRFLARVCAIMIPIPLLVPSLVSAFGIQVIIEGRTLTFFDVPQTAWYAAYVREAAEAGIVNGYKDAQGNLTGEFGPSNSITLAESLKIAVEGAGYDEEEYGMVIDSGTSHWASPYISVAKAENFLLLQSRSRVMWNDPATRAEVASFFASAFRVDTSDVMELGARYNDVDSATPFAAPIEALSRDGVVSGDTDTQGNLTGTFRPLQPIDRAEVVKMAIEARAAYGMAGEGRTPSENAQNQEHLVQYDGDRGFSPAVMRIKKGESVRFRNIGVSGMWVASSMHPTHTDYEGFDAERSLLQGEDYIFRFDRLGTWSYHNHVQPGHTGTVVVE